MTQSCHQNYWVADNPPCSSHGDCIDGKCFCYQGWTGRSDLEPQFGIDCDISVDSLKIWAAVNLTIGCLVLVIVVCMMFTDKAFHFTTIFSKYKTQCYYSFAIVNTSTIIYSTVKLIDPISYVVGRSIVCSFTSVGVISFSMIGVWAYFEMLILFLKSYSKFINISVRNRFLEHIRLVSVIGPKFPWVMSAIFVFIFAVSPATSDRYSDVFNIAFLSAVSVAYTYYVFTIIHILRVFLLEIEAFFRRSKEFAVSTNRVNFTIRQLHRKVKLVYRMISLILGTSVPLNIIFAVWWFLRRKVTYLIAFQLTMINILTLILIWSISPVHPNAIMPGDTNTPPTFTPSRLQENNIRLGFVPEDGDEGESSSDECLPSQNLDADEHNEYVQVLDGNLNC
jgi:hypothetical protein